MRRLKAVWMEYKGRRNEEYRVELTKMPTRYAPGINATMKQVSGLSGTTLIWDGSYKDVEVTVELVLTEGDRMAEVNAWLSGTGLLRFSDEPNLAYEARVIKNYKHQSVTKRLDGQSYTVVFSCKPFRVQYPPAGAMTITESGTKIHNPGTAAALPKVTITGSGDFTVTIGAQSVDFEDVTGGIVVDCRLMDALDLTETKLMNDHMEGTPWTIPPGMTEVSWTVESGAGITKIEILPRWRWM